MSSVEAPVGIELPLFAGNPGQHPGFDAAEVGADQHMPGCCTDHGAAAVAHHRERSRIELANVLIVAGRNRGDRSIEIVDDWALQILRLKTFTAQRPVAAPW